MPRRHRVRYVKTAARGRARRRTLNESKSVRHAVESAILVVALLWGGLATANHALAVPDVASPTAGGEVTVSAVQGQQGGTVARFRWVMASDGTVSMTAETSSPDGTSVFYGGEIVITLFCGARILSPTYEGHAGAESVRSSGGDVRGCGQPQLESEDHRAYEQFAFEGSWASISGKPVGSWTSAIGGDRVARTPMVRWNTELVGVTPMRESTLAVALSQTTSESVASVSPEPASWEGSDNGVPDLTTGPNETLEPVVVSWTDDDFGARVLPLSSDGPKLGQLSKCNGSSSCPVFSSVSRHR